MDDRTAWLDSWCKVRRPSQRDLARRWSGAYEPEPEPALVSPLEEMREYVRTTDLRPMKPDEPAPIEFSDPRKQSLFDSYARKYWRMMRIPA